MPAAKNARLLTARCCAQQHIIHGVRVLGVVWQGTIGITSMLQKMQHTPSGNFAINLNTEPSQAVYVQATLLVCVILRLCI